LKRGFPLATPAILPALTVQDLLTKGFFHDKVIPPLNSLSLTPAMAAMQLFVGNILNVAAAQNRYRLNIPRNKSSQHSVPKRKHLRRMLSVPNPLSYSILCDQIVLNWGLLHGICANSTLSMSIPTTSLVRGVQSESGQRAVASRRARRSVAQRFLLKTDLVRYYPSIYTHSIPWAIHGKDAARADVVGLLPGNRLDVCVREMQDKQTGGIPIGPDTSYILGEVIASRIDQMLQDRLTPLTIRGTRFIDDYHLYFRTRGEAEQAIAALHGVARFFELEINDATTEIFELPEAIEPAWKTTLRTHTIAQGDYGISCKAHFDRASELAVQFPNDSVYTYVAKKLLHAGISQNIWEVCETLLFRAALAEPSMLPILLRLLVVGMYISITCAGSNSRTDITNG
jgi:hypothetical protein